MDLIAFCWCLQGSEVILYQEGRISPLQLSLSASPGMVSKISHTFLTFGEIINV